MISTKAPSGDCYNADGVRHSKLDKVGLTSAYRADLDELTRYLKGVSRDDVTRFTRNMVDDTFDSKTTVSPDIYGPKPIVDNHS